MKVLTIAETNGAVTELHMLNPGQIFEGFGGSRHGLLVGKTASLIVRRKTSMGVVDTECDINDQNIWQAIARYINGEMSCKHATADSE